eukprot:4915805-Amphidinium_carterae.1
MGLQGLVLTLCSRYFWFAVHATLEARANAFGQAAEEPTWLGELRSTLLGIAAAGWEVRRIEEGHKAASQPQAKRSPKNIRNHTVSYGALSLIRISLLTGKENLA